MTDLSSDILNDARQIMRFRFSCSGPRCKPTQFAIVAIVGHPHLGSDQKNLAIEENQAAVVQYVLVNDRPFDEGCLNMMHLAVLVCSRSHADIDDNLVTFFILQNLGQHFPSMEGSITFKEMTGPNRSAVIFPIETNATHSKQPYPLFKSLNHAIRHHRPM